MKKLLMTLIKFAVTALVFFWINRTVEGGLAGMVTTCLSIGERFWALLIAVGIYIFSIYLGAYQWSIMLKNRGAHLPLAKVIRLYYTGMFFNNFILGTVAGDSFKVATLHTQEDHAKAGFASTFLDRFAGLTALSVYAVIGGITIAYINIDAQKDLGPTLMVLALFTSILTAMAALLLSTRVQKIFFSLLTYVRPLSVQQKIRHIVESVLIDHRDAKDRHMLRCVMFLSLTIQGLRIVTHIFAGLALGMAMQGTVHYFFVIIPITALVIMVPLPPAVPQAIAATLFVAAGFDEQRALVMELLALFVAIIGTLPGALYFIHDRHNPTATSSEEFL